MTEDAVVALFRWVGTAQGSHIAKLAGDDDRITALQQEAAELCRQWWVAYRNNHPGAAGIRRQYRDAQAALTNAQVMFEVGQYTHVDQMQKHVLGPEGQAIAKAAEIEWSKQRIAEALSRLTR